MRQEFSGQREGEKLLFVFRRSMLSMRKGFLSLVLLTGVGFVPFAIVPNNSNLLWIALIGVILGLIVFLYHWIGWYFTVYIVSNERIRQDRQKGLFNTSVVEITLDKIHNISVVQKGVLSNLLKYGTIVLQTYVGDLVIDMVPNVFEVREKLQNEINRASDKKTNDNEE